MYEPIKKLGQNFLSDPELASRMVGALGICDGDVVIEIGPGHGFLTEELSIYATKRNVKVYAVEIDRRFVDKLINMFEYEAEINVIEDDILHWLPEFTSERPIRIIGSLPFYITSPILHATIKMKSMPVSCVYLIQKEVADKTVSTKPDACYMSSFIQSFYSVQFLEVVSRDKFEPPPNVDGGVISLSKKDATYSKDFIERFEGFLHRAYKNPRKMLNKAFRKEELALCNISPTLRPQNIDPETWLDLFIKLNTRGNVDV